MTQSSIATCNAALDARNILLNGGKIEIRTELAADIDGAQAGIVLETLIIPATAFATASARAAAGNAVTPITAVSNAIAGSKHYVAYDSGDAVQRNGSAGTSGTDMILSADTWLIGDPVSITSWNTAEAK